MELMKFPQKSGIKNIRIERMTLRVILDTIIVVQFEEQRSSFRTIIESWAISCRTRNVKRNTERNVYVLFKLTGTKRLGEGGSSLDKNGWRKTKMRRKERWEGRRNSQDPSGRMSFREEGREPGCPTRTRRTTSTTTTMSRWCWRRKCYFFGTLSDSSKDIRRYSCQNVAETAGRICWTPTRRSALRNFGVACLSKGTAMKLVARNRIDVAIICTSFATGYINP